MRTTSTLTFTATALAMALLSAPTAAQPNALGAARAGIDAAAGNAIVAVQHKTYRKGRKFYRQRAYRGERAYAPTYVAPPREHGYRTSTGQWYPYCVIDLGYGRVEACGGSTPP